MENRQGQWDEQEGEVSGQISTEKLEQGFSLLAQERFEDADDLFEICLGEDPHCARAYLGKLMAEYCLPFERELESSLIPLSDSVNFELALRFADSDFRMELDQYRQISDFKIQQRADRGNYDRAVRRMNRSVNEDEYRLAARLFRRTSGGDGDAIELAEECEGRAGKAHTQAKRKRKRSWMVVAVLVAICFVVYFFGSKLK